MSFKSVQKRIVIEGRANGMKWKEIADLIYQETGILQSHDGLRRTANRSGWTKGLKVGTVNEFDEDSPGSSHLVIRKYDKDIGEITTKSLDIRTVENALSYAEVDLDVWEVVSQEIKTWDTTIGSKKSGTGQAETFTNYGIKIKLARIKEDLVEDAMYNLIDALENKTVKIANLKRPSKRNVVMFMGLFDHHLGKLAWHRESGDDYDVKIARDAYTDAIEDLLVKARGYEVSKIVFPIGNDFFHVDNFIDGKIGATAKGTPQDTDGRLPKIIVAGELVTIEAIEMCAAIAPVEVIYIPGNHDPMTSFGLARTLNAYFRNTKEVTVDSEPTYRKYRLYGKTLAGFTHGNEEKQVDLPNIMAGEAKHLWSQQEEAIWFVGHWHRRRETRFNAGETYGNVQVRVLPSLSGTDAWHYKKGYVNGTRAAEAHFFDMDTGHYDGFTPVHIREKYQGNVQ